MLAVTSSPNTTKTWSTTKKQASARIAGIRKPNWKSLLKPCLVVRVENLYSNRIRGNGIAKRK